MLRIILASIMILLISGTARAADCSNPSGPEAMLIYIPATHTEQVCNGTNWIPIKGKPAKAVPGRKEPPCPAVTQAPNSLSVACLTKGVMLREVTDPLPPQGVQ